MSGFFREARLLRVARFMSRTSPFPQRPGKWQTRLLAIAKEQFCSAVGDRVRTGQQDIHSRRLWDVLRPLWTRHRQYLRSVRFIWTEYKSYKPFRRLHAGNGTSVHGSSQSSRNRCWAYAPSYSDISVYTTIE